MLAKNLRKGKEKWIVALLSILMAIFSFHTPAMAQGVTFVPKPATEIRMDGNRIVWMAYGNNNWDIYMLDLTTGIQEKVTHHPADQAFPDIWGSYIVYMDNREDADPESSLSAIHDIYLYDLETKREQKISQTTGYHTDPIIADGKVVWVDQSTWKTVMLYDIATGQLKRVSSEQAVASGVQFDGKRIAWMDLRDGEDGQIFIYDLAKGKEEQITRSFGHKVDPLLADDQMVWLENHNGTSQLYMYNFKNERTTRVSAGPEKHRHLALAGDSLILIKGDKLVINNVNTVVSEPIAQPGGGIPQQVFFDGKQVIWYNGIQITIETLEEAKQRGLEYENQLPQPAKPVDHRTVWEPSNKKEAPTPLTNEITQLVKASETTIITSPDGLMQLTLSAGTFNRDVHVTLAQLTADVEENYLPVSLNYEWKVDGDMVPNKPYIVSVQYTSPSPYGKKVGMYTKSKVNRNWLYNPSLHDQTKKQFTSSTWGNRVSLMVFDKSFSDITNHWGREYVEVLTSHHMIGGYQDNTFKPDRHMTRAEFVKLLVSSFEPNPMISGNQSVAGFVDVPANFWGYSYIEYAQGKGWITGYEGHFYPNQPITREEMITMLMRVIKSEGMISEQANLNTTLDDHILQPFTDKALISTWAEEHVQKSVALGLIQGSDNKLNPKGNATRAETSALFYRFLEKEGRF